MSELPLFEAAAGQLLRALRGPRSQIAMARRLGYSGNPITDWEHGRRHPTAAETLRAATRCGVDVQRAFEPFLPATPPSAEIDWCVAPWLNSLRGSTSNAELARRARCSRFSVGRWLSGESAPRLPDFLRLLDAINGRAAEWVAALVPIERVPGLELIYRQVTAARRITFELPWSEAVLRVLETQSYAALPAHSDVFIAQTLGISEAEVTPVMRALQDSRLIELVAQRYRVTGLSTVDTRAARQSAARLRRHWTAVAASRAAEGTQNDADWFAYNVISVSQKDCDRIEQLLRAAYREIRGIVKESQPCERAALLTLQVVRWTPPS